MGQWLLPLLYPLPLALLAMLLGLALLWRHRYRAGVTIIAMAVAGLWLLATEPVADSLRAGLENQHPPEPIEAVPEVDAIVVLGGGVRTQIPPRLQAELGHQGQRVMHAARLYHAGKAPRIIATGGVQPHRAEFPAPSIATSTRGLLQEMGVDSEAITTSGLATDTWQESIAVGALKEELGLESILLVTSALHMPRSMATFKSLDLDIHPAATAHEVDETTNRFNERWTPDSERLDGVSRAWHEYLGLWYYRGSGRAAQPAAEQE